MSSAGDFLDGILAQGRRRPHARALVETDGRELRYGELRRRVENAAAALQRAGMQPGDPVLFTVRPSIASVTLILAVVRAGGVLVAADPRMGSEVFAARVALLQPRWVMAETAIYMLGAGRPLRRLVRGRVVELAPLAGIRARHVRLGPRLPGVPPSLRARDLWDAPRQEGERHAATPPHTGDDALAVVFTSGTTAAPKAVVHTDASLGASLEMLAEHLDLHRDDVVLTSELHLTLPALHAGSTTVIPPAGVSAAQRVARMRRHRATVAFAVPSDVDAVAQWAQRSGERMPATLRTLLMGSAPAPVGLLHRLIPALHPDTAVWSVYAMTEMLPVCRVSLEEKLDAGDDADLVGAPFPGVRCRVAEDGEVLVSGPNLFRGYHGDAPVGEHRTGDVGRLDAYGRLSLLGRRKDMILRGGENIYPALVEDSVARIDGVARCRLLGIADAVTADERVVLAVEPCAGVDARDLARRLHREMQRGPHRIDAPAQPDEVVVMPLPLQPRSRKVDTAALRQALAERPAC